MTSCHCVEKNRRAMTVCACVSLCVYVAALTVTLKKHSRGMWAAGQLLFRSV